MNQNRPLIPGVVYSGTVPMEAPTILVVAREKTGKSCLPISLKTENSEPLVLAFDDTGPDSAARLGSPLAHLKISRELGVTVREKMNSAMLKLEQYFVNGQKPYSTLVVDCASTMTDTLFEEASRISKNPDPRSHYGDVLNASKSFFVRLQRLNVPVIWLSWLREAQTVTENKKTRLIPGGAHITGGFREHLSGKAHQILMLERVHAMPGDPNANVDGFIRQFRTKPYAGVNCDGRYALPDPMPAHLGWVLYYIQNGYNPQAQNGVQAQQQVRQ